MGELTPYQLRAKREKENRQCPVFSCFRGSAVKSEKRGKQSGLTGCIAPFLNGSAPSGGAAEPRPLLDKIQGAV